MLFAAVNYITFIDNVNSIYVFDIMDKKVHGLVNKGGGQIKQ